MCIKADPNRIYDPPLEIEGEGYKVGLKMGDMFVTQFGRTYHCYNQWYEAQICPSPYLSGYVEHDKIIWEDDGVENEKDYPPYPLGFHIYKNIEDAQCERDNWISIYIDNDCIELSICKVKYRKVVAEGRQDNHECVVAKEVYFVKE